MATREAAWWKGINAGNAGPPGTAPVGQRLDPREAWRAAAVLHSVTPGCGLLLTSIACRCMGMLPHAFTPG